MFFSFSAPVIDMIPDLDTEKYDIGWHPEGICILESIYMKSSKFPVRFLAKLYEEDLRTNHGKNLDQISRLCGTPIQMLTSKMVKSKLTYYPVPEDETWRIPFCKELLQLRNDDNFYLPGFSFEEQTELLNYVCIS